MNRTYQGVRTILLAGLVLGITACRNDTTSTDSPAGLVNNSISVVHPMGSIKNADPPSTMPKMLARVLVTEDGQVLGILFSTPEGDFCEGINGTPLGFFTSKKTDPPSLHTERRI
jgi:hypothetical protein